MRFYVVSNEYIDYLQKIDSKVPNNSGPGYKSQKTYVGIILEIGSHKFLAPLTSYKQNQDRIKSSSPTAFKIHERLNPDNKLGMISLNYMIPVIDSEITELDVDNQQEPYRTMLYRQFEFIKANRQEIIDRAEKLHDSIVVKRTPFFVNVSCDIQTLVDEYKKFKK